jgi:Tfp pilus assembly protein PilO
MRRDFALRKRIILGGVIFLVLADVALAAYTWELSNAPNAPQQRMTIEARQHDVLKADIRRAQDIRDNIPAIQKDCDNFEQALFPDSSGYSAVRSELGGTARKHGIQLEDLTFKRTEDASRGVTEVLIDVTVNGDYKSVIAFLNGLQRSPSLFVIDALMLGSENTNQASSNVIKVSLHLRTYFRTAA